MKYNIIPLKGVNQFYFDDSPEDVIKKLEENIVFDETRGDSFGKGYHFIFIDNSYIAFEFDEFDKLITIEFRKKYEISVIGVSIFNQSVEASISTLSNLGYEYHVDDEGNLIFDKIGILISPGRKLNHIPKSILAFRQGAFDNINDDINIDKILEELAREKEKNKDFWSSIE